MDVLAQPSDLRRMFLRSFGRESFAVVGPLALTGAPHIRRAPFLLLKDALPVRRLASSLPASFSADLAVGPAYRLVALRFVWVAATSFPEDFHLLSMPHAGHTNEKPPRKFARGLSNSELRGLDLNQRPSGYES